MPSYKAVNGYKAMWMMVLFDLPIKTSIDQKRANDFRKKLLKDGFNMMQYSVYIRFCSSAESRDVHKKRIDSFVPNNGKVSIIEITDKQYGRIASYIGRKEVCVKRAPRQLEMF